MNGRTSTSGARRQGLWARARAFRQGEDGSMVIFSIFLVLVMLMIGGMAVDLMRFESTRARLQSTLDRAILAAADLDQTLPPIGVVEDYFERQGMGDDLTSITAVRAINSSQVSATAEIEMNTYFMDLLGFDTLTAPAAGTAREEVSDIEIIMVLDVSGSMNSNNRLPNLREAAYDFVEAVLENDVEDRISIAIVPFNGQVNLGPVLRSQFNVIDRHGVDDSECVDLPASVYNALSLSQSLPMPQTAWADTFSFSTGLRDDNADRIPDSVGSSYVYPSDNRPRDTNRWCPAEAGNFVLLPTSDLTTLNNHIRDLYGIGATSINAGMRWGMTLIDPAKRPMFATLRAGSHVPPTFADQPFDFQRDNTMKIIVLMTDGEHFAEERVNDGYRTGLSPIWRSGSSTYSILHASRTNTNKYWVPSQGAWYFSPYNSGGTPVRLTWPEVWEDLRMSWVAWQLYARANYTAAGVYSTNRLSTYNQTMNAFRSLTPTTTMDDQLQDMCDFARANRVIVFGVAFEAPFNGQAQIAQCATSPAHYFNAQGLQIQTVFNAIAAQIQRLKLIQ